MSYHSSQFTVVLDACVLYPAPLRDLLLRLAGTGLYRARWTDQIHDEWIRNLRLNRPDLDPARLHRTRQLIDKSVPDCLVSGFEYLIEAVTLPDPDDRHVLAAAIVAQADLIVTANLKDFPAESLAPHNLEAKHPDDFLVEQFDLQAAKFLGAVAEHRAALKSPPKSQKQYLETLSGLGLPQIVEKLKDWTIAY
ncbi:PIN domain-containing protein [Acidithiobacillus sp. MC6.1]|nr:PIN domain-containing protein [Acidithiobacillus sp. MC6.1]